jgi:hypothetical protein
MYLSKTRIFVNAEKAGKLEELANCYKRVNNVLIDLLENAERAGNIGEAQILLAIIEENKGEMADCKDVERNQMECKELGIDTITYRQNNVAYFRL